MSRLTRSKSVSVERSGPEAPLRRVASLAESKESKPKRTLKRIANLRHRRQTNSPEVTLNVTRRESKLLALDVNARTIYDSFSELPLTSERADWLTVIKMRLANARRDAATLEARLQNLTTAYSILEYLAQLDGDKAVFTRTESVLGLQPKKEAVDAQLDILDRMQRRLCAWLAQTRAH